MKCSCGKPVMKGKTLCMDCQQEYEAVMDGLAEDSLEEWIKWHGR